MSTTTWGPCDDAVAEVDRLREINAEVLGALEAIATGHCQCIEPDFPGESKIVCHPCIARTAIAKARGTDR